MAKQADTSSISQINNITSTALLAGVPSTDTILRSAILSSIKISEITCTNPYSFLIQKPQASIGFGFPLNSWLDSLLPNSIASSKYFKFSMSDDFTNQQVDVNQFPSCDLRKTAVLLSGAFVTVFEQFAGGSAYFNAYGHTRPSIKSH